MQRTYLFFACFFIGANCMAQQYPFVHYTPKDGLISNRVRSIYQDSKGKLYFNTLNGLSVYDGARFTNYTTEDGLDNDIVNCVMEMGDDSVWVVTNGGYLNYLANGKVNILRMRGPTVPVINYLCRSESGTLYAAADGGLLVFENNGFTRLPFSDIYGNDVNSYISFIIPYSRYLLVLRDYTLIANKRHVLYLYNISQKKIVSQTPADFETFSMTRSNDGRVWISTNKGIKQLNIEALGKGNLILDELPSLYRNFNDRFGGLYFDNNGHCWLTNGANLVKRCDTNGNITVFTTASGLSTTAISSVFHDREGIIWLASSDAGVEKLMHTNLSLIKKPFGFLYVSNLAAEGSGEKMLLYSSLDKKIAHFTSDNSAETISVNVPEGMGLLGATPENLYGIHSKKIFRLKRIGAEMAAELVFTETSENNFGQTIADKNGNLILSGSYYLTALRGREVFQLPMSYTDQLAMDRQGKIWTATRNEQLFQFSTHPDKPAAYLKQEALFEKELKGLAPRSIAVDNEGKIWMGTRWKGLYVFEREKEKLNLLYHFTSKTGLTENFICWLTCDADNNIWAGSPSGLDKIRFENKEPVIENITRQNNMYQYIYSIIVDKNKTAWAVSSGGLIKVTPGNTPGSGYTPQLMFTQIRSGADTLNGKNGTTLSYKQNNLSFNFAALSFLDEKQILYSYRLQGSSNSQWSEPVHNATASFIDLRPGAYTLSVKAKFPAGRYAEQIINYSFLINPPWWQTWWFRIPGAVLIIGILIFGIRFYYRRKLEKQKTLMEKQQAIEKERTRIATDMHDDLGAGLSRIKFLSETIGIKQQQEQPIEEDISKIREYSHEMIDKMGEIVWALNEKNDSLSDLLAYTRAYAMEYLSQNGIRCHADLDEQAAPVFVSGEFRRNIYLTIKEALHNVVKHAQASDVFIKINTGGKLNIQIQDNGVGFDKTLIRPFSNGLTNMEKRIKEIGGRFSLLNEKGTLVKITVPLPG